MRRGSWVTGDGGPVTGGYRKIAILRLVNLTPCLLRLCYSSQRMIRIELDDEEFLRIAGLLEGIQQHAKSIEKKLDRVLGMEIREAADLTALGAVARDTVGLVRAVAKSLEDVAASIDDEPELQALSAKLRASAEDLKASIHAVTPPT
jgi:hypothetical protein